MINSMQILETPTFSKKLIFNKQVLLSQILNWILIAFLIYILKKITNSTKHKTKNLNSNPERYLLKSFKQSAPLFPTMELSKTLIIFNTTKKLHLTQMIISVNKI